MNVVSWHQFWREIKKNIVTSTATNESLGLLRPRLTIGRVWGFFTLIVTWQTGWPAGRPAGRQAGGRTNGRARRQARRQTAGQGWLVHKKINNQPTIHPTNQPTKLDNGFIVSGYQDTHQPFAAVIIRFLSFFLKHSSKLIFLSKASFAYVEPFL